jgi:exopolyphosphatase / guanosine-5'-triphosphate,3'-diphosphate pyrophosphatase
MRRLNIIDMGSNAIRYVLSELSGNTYSELVYKRFPYLLSELNYLNKHDIELLFEIFKDICKNVDNNYQTIAVATGHFREKENFELLKEKLLEVHNIKIRLLSGKEEAGIIIKAVSHHVQYDNYIHVDLGGASLEINIIKKNKIIFSNSNPIGLLKVLRIALSDKREELNNLFLKEVKGLKKSPILVLSGGNSNFIAEKMQTIRNNEVFAENFKKFSKEIMNSSIEKRMSSYEISNERAQKLTASFLIFNYLLEKIEAEKVVFSKTGLREGLMLHYQ